jgi:DNA/RNA-binding domain of Phe-tRNA-synthetase-like protein
VSASVDSTPTRGWCDREVQAELPGLGLMYTTIQVDPRVPLTGESSPAVRQRLRELSNRWQGPRAIHLRHEPVPAAYRVFFRHIGLDPDVTMTPIEAIVLERMLDGGFKSRGMLADILAIALIDTSIPVWALDADTVHGPLGVRISREQECLGRDETAKLGGGRLVVADAEGVIAVMFGGVSAAHAPTASTQRLQLFAVQVAGVPALHVEETLWMCRAALELRAQAS